MRDKKKYNQPYYTEPVEKKQSNISNRENDIDGFYLNSEAFPPRGSFINIPEDIIFSRKAMYLNDIVEDKAKNIGSDLYEDTKNTKDEV